MPVAVVPASAIVAFKARVELQSPFCANLAVTYCGPVCYTYIMIILGDS